MCLIIDADVAPQVFTQAPTQDFLPVFEWLHDHNKNGCLVFGGRLRQELDNRLNSRKYLAALYRAGRARLIPDSQVRTEEERLLRGRLCRSNDPHIIALALISGARTLCSGDRDLQSDFTNRHLICHPRGRVYKSAANHTHLLCHTPSCSRK